MILLLLGHPAVEAQALHLLLCSSEIQKLLLETLRLLSQVLIGSHQLRVILRVKILIIGCSTELERGRSENLRKGIHLTIPIHAEALAVGKATANGSVRHATPVLVVLRATLSTVWLLDLSRRSRCWASR